MVIVPDGGGIATSPSSYAGLFLVRKVSDGLERLERIATPTDFAAYPEAPLRYFEPRGPGADAALASGANGDLLSFDAAQVPHWLQADAPYDTVDFWIDSREVRVQGVSPKVFVGSQIQLPGYTFTVADLGRWVLLSGLPSAPHNGWCQVIGYQGDTATVNRVFYANETGTNWGFYRFLIETDAGPTLEPRYFPTCAIGLTWQLTRGGTTIAAGNGGCTMRDTEAPLVRSIRFTSLEPSLGAAIGLQASTRAHVQALQSAEAEIGTTFGVTTTTYGP